MRLRPSLLAALLLVAVPQVSAEAAVLVEGRKHGEAFRMVVDAERQRALVRTPRGETLVDLAEGAIYVRPRAGVARKARIEPPGDLSTLGYRVEPWGPGPIVAGHASVYHVITHGADEICAEMLVSGWMKEFIQPVVQALDLLEGLSHPTRGHGCDRVPFAVYAAAGWPLMAGKIDRLTFETRRISFDYQPRRAELAIPVHAEEVGRDVIVREAIAPGR